MNILHIGSANINYSKITNNMSDTARKTEKQDEVSNNKSIKVVNSLGANVNKNNILKDLVKQKEKLTDSKNALIETTLKNGDSPLSIKQQLEDIDKQIEEIDKMINNIQLEEKRKSEKTENKKKSDDDLLEDNKKSDATNNILALSEGLTKTKSLSSQRNLMISASRELKAEIKLDTERGLDPVRKKKELSKLEDKIDDITNNLSNHIIETNNKTNKAVTKNKEKENEEKLLSKEKQAIENISNYVKNSKEADVKINILA